MTLSEIYSGVCALCPDLYPQLDDSFTAALRRAVADIAQEMKLEGSVRILANGQKPHSRVEKFSHTANKTETLPLVGRAYSLFVVGEGRFTVRCGRETKVRSFSTTGRLYRGFIDGEGVIVFEGEYDFEVYSLTTYDRVYSESEEDIPKGEGRREYNVRDFCTDFGGVLSPVTDDAARPYNDVTVTDGIISAPESLSGALNIKYRRVPTVPDVSDKSGNIDLPCELTENVILLTAVWLMLADDAERSEYYMSFYRDSISKYINGMHKNLDTGYYVPNRWA